MRVYVEAPEEEKEGAFAYKVLIEEIITDLGLGRVIEEVRIYADTRKMLFYIEVKEKPTMERMEVKDVVNLTEKGTSIEVEITNETYAPYLLNSLWDIFGERNVSQIRRNFLEIKGAKKEDILTLPLALTDIKEKEKDALIRDMILRIIPIGFRIIRKMPPKDSMTVAYIASENPITEEIIKEVKTIISKPPSPLSITEEEVIKKREHKKVFVPYKEFYA